jgi:hypothetical protein
MPCKTACPPEWKPFGQPVLRSCLGLWGQWDVGETGPGGRIGAVLQNAAVGGAFGAKIGQNRIKSDKIGQNRVGFLASDSVKPYKDQWVTGRKSSQNRMNQLVSSLLEKKNII